MIARRQVLSRSATVSVRELCSWPPPAHWRFGFLSEVATKLIVQSSSVMPRYVAKTEIAFAGFWRRSLAYLIDATLLAGVEIAIASSIAVLAPTDFQSLANVIPVSSALWWAYFVVMESSPAQGTLGKLALGLYVADVHGDPITFRRASFRNAFKIFSTLILLAGWVMAGFTPRKQALHDLLAGTLVLRKVHYFVIGPDAPVEPGDHWDGAGWVASVPPLEES